MEARMAEIATTEARIARVVRTIGGVTGNRAEPSIAEPSGHIQELIEDGDLDSATEEDTGALSCSNPEVAFSTSHLRAKFPIDGLGLLILSSSNRTLPCPPP